MKLTEWYSPKTNPVHIGVYERDYGPFGQGNTGYAKWDGSYWYFRSSTPKMAEQEDWVSVSTSARWRGLAEKP